MFTVYKIEAKFAKKVYIGCTKDFKKRIRQHEIKSSNGHLRADIDKYGWEKFSVEMLHTFESQSDALMAERDYWEKYQVREDYELYNVSMQDDEKTQKRKRDDDALETHIRLNKWGSDWRYHV